MTVFHVSYSSPSAARHGRRYTMELHAKSVSDARRILRRSVLPNARLLHGLWPPASKTLKSRRRSPVEKLHALVFLALRDCRDRRFAERWLDDETGLLHIACHLLQSREQRNRQPWFPTWEEFVKRVEDVERRIPGYVQ